MDFSRVPRPVDTYHTEPYPSISPSRPELSLKGKHVLITGGATGIGFEMTKAFAQAGAAQIALLARSQAPMDEAKKTIETDCPETKVLTYSASVSDNARVNAIVKELGTIDVLCLNAAAVASPNSVLDVPSEEVEEVFRTNVLGPLNLAKAFAALPPRSPDAERTIIYTSSAGFQFTIPGVGVYNASKPSMNYLISMIAQEYKEKKIRAFSFHPGVHITPLSKDAMKDAPSLFKFDDPELPGHFAVWLCSKEADFLNGRFMWAHWDVNDLMAKKDLIQNDPYQLKLGVVMSKVQAN